MASSSQSSVLQPSSRRTSHQRMLASVFRGELATELPSAVRSRKIFICSTGRDFEQERRRICGSLQTELHQHFQSHGLDIQIIDGAATTMGTGGPCVPCACPVAGPWGTPTQLATNRLAEQLHEINECHRLSPRCFVVCLIGNKYGDLEIPGILSTATFALLKTAASGDDNSFLEEIYKLDTNAVPPHYIFCPPSCEDAKDSDSQSQPNGIDHNDEWRSRFCRLYRKIQSPASTENAITVPPLLSAVEHQVTHCLQLSEGYAHDPVLVVVRDFEGINFGDESAVDFVCVTDGVNPGEDFGALAKMKKFRAKLEKRLQGTDNLMQFSVPWKNGGLDPEHPEHASYLQKLCQQISKKLKDVIGKSLAEDELLNSLNKPLQEVYVEVMSHRESLRDHVQRFTVDLSDCLTTHLRHIEGLVRSAEARDALHGPIFVTGNVGSGKSALLARVIDLCDAWCVRKKRSPDLDMDIAEMLPPSDAANGGDFPQGVVKIIRRLGRSPASSYTSQVVQGLFCQMSIAFGITTSQIHPNMEFPELCAHVQELVTAIGARRSVSGTSSTSLVLVLDDVHLLQAPSFEDILLSDYLPWNLPPNVHVICTFIDGPSTAKVVSAAKANSLTRDRVIELGQQRLDAGIVKSSIDAAFVANHRTLTDAQKDILLSACNCAPSFLGVSLHTAVALTWTSFSHEGDNSEEDCGITSALEKIRGTLKAVFGSLERRFGKHAVAQMAQYLCCVRYGIAESEIQELLSFLDDVFPASASNIDLSASKPSHHSVVAWRRIKHAMRILLRDTLVGQKLLFSWKDSLIRDVAREMYLSDKVARATHSDIATFLLGFLSEREDNISVSSYGELASICSVRSADSKSRRLSFRSYVDADGKWIGTTRQIDELWYHLLQSGDIAKIKQVTVCNFEFLLVAMCTVSIHYTVSVLEFVRAQILDFELDLVYYSMVHSREVLSKNPLELASVVISWLRPYSEVPLETIETMVTQAMEWCDNSEQQLLVPLNTWLWNPLPEMATTLWCARGVRCFVYSHDAQAVICSDGEKGIHMYGLSAKKLLKTFTGHYGHVVCLHVSVSGKYLISGSEDTTTIVWDIQTGGIRHRISEHIATVTCVSTAQNDSLIISGSEDSRVLVADAESGKLVHKLEHHRGMITCLAVANDTEILVTGAADNTVCVWSVENFSLLNTLSFVSPIVQIDLSNDRTFLLVACEDDKLYLRSLTTGSEIHCLQGHKSQVTSVCIANDNCRALVGCRDNRVYMYDIHTAKLLRVFGGHDGAITGVKVTKDDGFLFTSGGDSLKVWYFGPSQFSTKLNNKETDNHSERITCIDISKDGYMAVTGSEDCLLKVWQLTTSELHSTLEGHTGPVTCVACAPNGLFAVSGSQDRTVRVWGLTIGLMVSSFKEHDASICSVAITSDSRQVLSADAGGNLRLWLSDSGVPILSCRGPTKFMDITINMKIAVCGNGDNFMRIVTLTHENHKHTVTHKDAILCHALTVDSKNLITGSKDMSLKVWELPGGRLTQVLVGHNAAVTCVALAPLNRNLVVSGSQDCNLIVWDLKTGHEVHTMTCHTGTVTCVRLTVDGNTAVSGSHDGMTCVWDTQSGTLMTLFMMHSPITNLVISFDANHIVVHMDDSRRLPLLCLHNCSPIDIVAYRKLMKAMEEETTLSAALPRKVHHRILQKEMSLDSYTWAKRYGSAGSRHAFSSSLEDCSLQDSSPISTSTQNLQSVLSQSKSNLHTQGDHFEELKAAWEGAVPGGGAKPPQPKSHAPPRRQMSAMCFPVLPEVVNVRRKSKDAGCRLMEAVVAAAAVPLSTAVSCPSKTSPSKSGVCTIV